MTGSRFTVRRCKKASWWSLPEIYALVMVKWRSAGQRILSRKACRIEKEIQHLGERARFGVILLTSAENLRVKGRESEHGVLLEKTIRIDFWAEPHLELISKGVSCIVVVVGVVLLFLLVVGLDLHD